jgi:hypothetical protein
MEDPDIQVTEYGTEYMPQRTNSEDNQQPNGLGIQDMDQSPTDTGEQRQKPRYNML